MTNDLNIDRSKSPLFPYVALISSLLLIYLDDALLVFSPSILISVFFLAIYFIHGRLLVGLDFFIVLFLFSSVFFLTENQSVKELLRVIYIYGGISLAYYYKHLSKELSLKAVFIILFSILILDFLLRIFVSSDFQNLSIYSIKDGGGLYSDSNYSGLLIVVAITELYEKHGKKLNSSILLMLFLLVMTFSRTSLFMLAFYMFSLKYKSISVFTILLSFLALLYLAFYSEQIILNLSVVDGSLNSKYFILQSFGELMREDLGGLLFGLGRTNEQVLEAYGYTGHTLFGQFVQFGIIQVFLLVYLLYKYLKIYSSNSSALFLTILFGGMFSFFPSSYIGLIVIITAVIKFSRK